MWNSAKGHRLSTTEGLKPSEILGSMAASLLYVNRSIYLEASRYLYGTNLFHFDFIVNNDFTFDGPNYSHNVITFLASLSERSRKAVRKIRIAAAAKRLRSSSDGGWLELCKYLALKADIKNLSIVIVNNCTTSHEDARDMVQFCCIDNPWARALTLIPHLKSFDIHTARCQYKEAEGKGSGSCLTALPLPMVLSGNEVLSPLTAHLARFHFAPYYGREVYGACVSQEFRDDMLRELGILQLDGEA